MSTFQASQAVHGSVVMHEQHEQTHAPRPQTILSYDPYDLPDAKSECGIVEILNLHFESF